MCPPLLSHQCQHSSRERRTSMVVHAVAFQEAASAALMMWFTADHITGQAGFCECHGAAH